MAENQPTTTTRKKKSKRTVSNAILHVFSSFNNTIITITDTNGGALTTSSAGACGFRGSKKGTAYAAQVAAQKAISTAKQQYGVSKVNVSIKGIGMGREAAVRVLISENIAVESIKDVTGIPHGGCRPRKARRV
ncbi:30S ribosomal protein S11 [Candidatus Saccharibacteria bacterium RIFCSPHIGHO2_12_FULL_41_12]|nr:MAG: 30S ribosomal protein S11 [Candidatus Saccharibacteria bacterium RIFCSPHIGHO2_12_FULL_41_12]